MPTFEEAREIAERFAHRDVNSYGLADEGFFYITLMVGYGHAPMCGESTVIWVDRNSGEAGYCPPYPTPDCGYWTATEQYGDYPNIEYSEPIDWDSFERGDVGDVDLNAGALRRYR